MSASPILGHVLSAQLALAEEASPLPLGVAEEDWLSGVHIVAMRIAIAAALGTVVALLYRASRAAHSRHPGFGHTLILLAPLIAMVTIAVGQNVAAAFTLVGTLAIVRFRTVIQDSRDMAFVIFSVAVGMALGTFDLVVAGCGVLIIGLVILLLGRIDRRANEPASILRLVLSPPEADPSLYAAILESHGGVYSISRSSMSRASGELELRLQVLGIPAARSPELLTELLRVPEITRASFSLTDGE